MASLELISTRGFYGTATDRIVAISTRGFYDVLSEVEAIAKILSRLLPDRYRAEILPDRYRAEIDE